MQNEDKRVVDLYIPRKCALTNKLIHSKDHASVSTTEGETKISSVSHCISIADVDEKGVITGRTDTINIGGYMRRRGFADKALNRLFYKKGLLTFLAIFLL